MTFVMASDLYQLDLVLRQSFLTTDRVLVELNLCGTFLDKSSFAKSRPKFR